MQHHPAGAHPQRVPSPEFLAAAQAVAHAAAVDVGKVIAGYPLTCNGVTFWLQHYGAADPTGMVLTIEVGTLEGTDRTQAVTALLEFNYLTSAGLHGYCALMPGSDLIAYCIRLPFDGMRKPAEAIFAIVDGAGARLEQMRSMVAAGRVHAP